MSTEIEYEKARKKLESTAYTNKLGYLYSIKGERPNRKFVCVHRELALRFLPNPNNYSDVNHINGIKSDNSWGNLEWCSRSHNIKHAYDTGLRKPAHTGKFNEKHHRSIPIVGENEKGQKVEFPSLNEAQRQGFSAPHISQCLSGKRKTHLGYVWTKK